MAHARKVINGYGPATVLDALLGDAQTLMTTMPPSTASEEDENEGIDTGNDAPDFAPIPAMPAPDQTPMTQIPSLGLW